MDWQTKLKDLRITGAVIECRPDQSLAEVRQILKESKIGSIVITNEGRVTGIFTERDYLMKVAGHEVSYDARPIRDFMTPRPQVLDGDNTVLQALELMRDGGFRHIVVTDADGAPLSMVSIKDILLHVFDTFNNVEDALKDLVACIA